MESNDNAAAARTCLVVVVVAALLVIVALALLILGPFDVLPQKPTPTPDPQSRLDANGPLVFSIMDVGQGLCVVVITPDGHSLVADGGRSADRMQQYVIPYLREHGVTRVDYIVSTNPDQDHLGGLERLLQLLPVVSCACFHHRLSRGSNSHRQFGRRWNPWWFRFSPQLRRA